jgi:hypothetical protein
VAVERIRRLETFAKAGFLARGVLYSLLGYFAVATGSGEGSAGILQRIQDAPAGPVLLVVMSLGLAGYGVFRLFSAWLNLDGKKDDAKGGMERAGQALSGVVHLILAFAALRLALATRGEGSAGSGAEAVGQVPGGWMLLAVAGLLMIVGGLGNFLQAWAAALRRMIGPDAPRWMEPAGRAGYAARGAVFLVIGWQLIMLGLGSADPQPGTESALDALRSREWLFHAVAAGLGLFGAYNLLLARYARISEEDVVDRLKGAASGART